MVPPKNYNAATGLTLTIQRMAGGVLKASRATDSLLQRAQAIEARGDRPGAARYREAAESARRDTEAKVREVQSLSREAVSHYRRSIDIQPLNIRSYANLGLVLASLGQVDEALSVYSKGIGLEARYYGGTKAPTLWFNYSQALLGLQRFEEAVPACRTAWRLMPGDRGAEANLVQALVGLSWIRSTSGDPAIRSSEEALACMDEALRLVPNPSPAMQDVRVAVLADAGRFSEAVAIAATALRSAREQRDDRLAAALAVRLELYAGGKAYRESR